MNLTGLLDLLERKLSGLAVHVTQDGMTDYRSVLDTLEAMKNCIDPKDPQPDARPGVLFVDDEEIIRRIGTRVLENAGYTVFTAADGAEALEVFLEHRDRVGCVVLDLVMPRLDGIQTYHKLRALSPGIAVIMTTGYGEGEIKSKFEKLDLSGFLRKPFTASALSELVSECVGKAGPDFGGTAGKGTVQLT